ncbi:MAG: LPS export ABC transporter periplasmic protein LptC [Desulfuromonadales bacterium]|nr:LPS export ABC transporter periplasmic protein LptC [Desulfuromonadales bacterium]
MSGVLKKRHLLPVLAILLAVVLATAVTLGRQPGETVVRALKALPDNVDLALETIDYTHLVDGVRRWRLQAERVERRAGSEGLEISMPRLTLFDEGGDDLGEATAATGWVKNDYSRVHLVDNVEVEHRSGYRLYTARLDFDQASRMIVTDAPVRLVGEKLELLGTGLTLDLANEKLLVPADVRTVFRP